jgi:hypothetical protein
VAYQFGATRSSGLLFFTQKSSKGMMLISLLLALWICWLLFLSIGNIRLQQRWTQPSKINSASTSISWLLPFRNEADNIQRMLANTSKHRLPNFLWINDNSADSGPLELLKTQANLIQNEGQGKKDALITAWKKNGAEWSLHTDADVEWTEECMAEWEQALNQVSEQTILVAGLPTVFGNPIDAEDFRANMFTAAGMAGWGFPFLCSGAALAVRSKRLSEPWRPWLGPGNSGDDVFLLHHVLATFGPQSVRTLPCPNLKVRGAQNLGTALKQRLRWAGKSILFRNPAAISVSLFIYGLHLTGLLFLLMPFPLWQKILLIGAKAIADLTLSGGKSSGIGPRLFLSILYWIYIPLLPILAWLSLPWREAKKVW